MKLTLGLPRRGFLPLPGFFGLQTCFILNIILTFYAAVGCPFAHILRYTSISYILHQTRNPGDGVVIRIPAGQFVAIVYGKDWYVACIDERYNEHKDIFLRFTHLTRADVLS